jgi:hypothetical protein
MQQPPPPSRRVQIKTEPVVLAVKQEPRDPPPPLDIDMPMPDDEPAAAAAEDERFWNDVPPGIELAMQDEADRIAAADARWRELLALASTATAASLERTVQVMLRRQHELRAEITALAVSHRKFQQDYRKFHRAMIVSALAHTVEPNLDPNRRGEPFLLGNILRM